MRTPWKWTLPLLSLALLAVVAIGVARALMDGTPRVAIVDCDVHQGDGTAELAEGDDTVFTMSIHGANTRSASTSSLPLSMW